MLTTRSLPHASTETVCVQLEKSRVAHQLPGERNYHIFYQLCTGVTPAEAAGLRLPRDALARFRYLNTSGCTAIAGVSDAADFVRVRSAMSAVSIDEAAQVGANMPAFVTCQSFFCADRSLAQLVFCWLRAPWLYNWTCNQVLLCTVGP